MKNDRQPNDLMSGRSLKGLMPLFSKCMINLQKPPSACLIWSRFQLRPGEAETVGQSHATNLQGAFSGASVPALMAAATCKELAVQK
jgi:hypothetical protein